MISAHLEFSPAASQLMDQEARLNISGLPPNAAVQLAAQVTDDMGVTWRSEFPYTADADGQIRLDGDQTMRLITHMRSSIEGVIFANYQLHSLTVQVTVNSADGTVLASADWERRRLPEGVTRHVVRDDGLFASLFLPSGEDKVPVIIIVSGSNGSLSETRGAVAAGLGVAAFSLAYFAYETLPKGLVDIPLEYFETAIRWLQAHPRIDPNKIIIHGGSRGGELSLLLGATFPAITGVIANVPSGYVWSGFTAEDTGGSIPNAWTYRGEPLPSVPFYQSDATKARIQAQLEAGIPVPLTPGFDEMIAHAPPEALDAAALPDERINGSVLLVAGADDQMWGSGSFAAQVADRLKQKGFAHPVMLEIFPDAGHFITPPYIPATALHSKHPVDGNLYAYGGTPDGNAHAQRGFWAAVRQFLSTYFSLQHGAS